MVDIVPVTANSEVENVRNEASRLVSKLNEPGSAAPLAESRALAVQGVKNSAKAVERLATTDEQLDALTQQYMAARQVEAEAQQKQEPLNTKAMEANLQKKSANLEAYRPLAEENLKSIEAMQSTRKVLETRRAKLAGELDGVDQNGKKLPGIVRLFNAVFRSDIEAAHNQALTSQLAVEQTLGAKIGNTANLLSLELSANQMQSKEELAVEQRSLATQEAIRMSLIDVNRIKDSIEMLGKLHGWKKETAAAYLEQARANGGLYSNDLNSVMVLTAQQNANLAAKQYADYNEYLAAVRRSGSSLLATGQVNDNGLMQFAKDTWEGRGANQWIAMYGARGASMANQLNFGVGQMAAMNKAGIPFSKQAKAAAENPYDPFANQTAAEAAKLLRLPAVQAKVQTGTAETLLGPGKTWKDVEVAMKDQILDRDTVYKAMQAEQYKQLDITTAPDQIGPTLWTGAVSDGGFNISPGDIDTSGLSPETAALVKKSIPDSLLKTTANQEQFDAGLQEMVTNLLTLAEESKDRVKFLQEVSEKMPTIIQRKADVFGLGEYPAATGRKTGVVTPTVKIKVGSAEATINPATPLGWQRLMQLAQLRRSTRGIQSTLSTTLGQAIPLTQFGIHSDFARDQLIKLQTGQTPTQVTNP